MSSPPSPLVSQQLGDALRDKTSLRTENAIVPAQQHGRKSLPLMADKASWAKSWACCQCSTSTTRRSQCRKTGYKKEQSDKAKNETTSNRKRLLVASGATPIGSTGRAPNDQTVQCKDRTKARLQSTASACLQPWGLLPSGALPCPQ